MLNPSVVVAVAGLTPSQGCPVSHALPVSSALGAGTQHSQDSQPELAKGIPQHPVQYGNWWPGSLSLLGNRLDICQPVVHIWIVCASLVLLTVYSCLPLVVSLFITVG